MDNHASHYYWYNGKKILLNSSKKNDAFYISQNSLKSFKSNLKKISQVDNNDNIIDIGNGVFILDKETNTRFQNFTNNFTEKNGRKIELYDNGSTLLIAQNNFIVQFKKNTTDNQIDLLNKKFNTKIISRFKWDDKCFLLAIKDVGENKVIEISNEYHENELVEFSHPNFITVFQAPSVNDIFFNKQWALLNKGQTGGITGNDIKVSEAWNITQGDSSITVAIIDDGIDYNHEDLNIPGKLATPYNAFTKRDNNDLGILDSHGTSCAGIVSATGNNQIGVIGVAPKCRLMGIKIMTKVSNTSWIIDPMTVADGINIAVQRGADILSNSWFIEPFDIVRKAILDAKQRGRNGKGCVVCCAAGNNSGPVVFPANLQEVLTVSACNEFGEFKTPFSRDNEKFWGSSFGNEVDICAPGVHIVTTTKMFNMPNPPLRNYILNFNGTSAATPFVAGVAALILSIKPNLTALEVEKIIKSTCDDLGQQVPNNNIGFGRINALSALLALKPINS